MPAPDPDTVSFSCPFCARKLRVKSASAGKRIKCPNPPCGQTISVPAPVAAEAPLELDDAPPEPHTPPARPRTRTRPAPVEDDDVPAKPNRARLWIAVGAAAFVLIGGVAVWQLTKKREDTAGGGGGSGGSGSGVINVASGPRVVETGKLPDGITIDRYYIASEFEADLRRSEPPNQWPQTLPSGTERIYVGIGFPFEPPNGTGIRVELSNASGPVKLGGGITMTIRSPKGTVVELECAPRDGPFADGEYKVKVFINDKDAVVLNWAVSGRLVGVDANGLKGTAWRSGEADAFAHSGYRLEFGADGTFTYTSSGGQPAKGQWKAEGETFTAYADPAPGETKGGGGRRRTEFKGLCLKDELRVKTRSEHQFGEPGSPEKFGSWHAIPLCRKDDGKLPKKDKDSEPSGKGDGSEPPPKSKEP